VILAACSPRRFDRDHAALAVLLGLNGLRVSEACGTNIEDLAVQRGHRTLHILGKGNKPATIPLVPRTARTIDLVVGERHEGPDPAPHGRSAVGSAHRAPVGRLDRQTRRARHCPSAHAARRVHHGRARRRVPLRDVQIAARHADPRTTIIYDRRRQNFDRHAAYVVVAFVAGG
jgi:integrase/recombinase XerD